MSDNPIKSWIEERRAIHAAATAEMYFQHWGGQNQNGDNAESILIDERTGDSLAYGLPDADGESIVDAHNMFPAALSAIEAVLELHTKETGGTPDGSVADVCSCGMSYYPCPTVRALKGVIDGE